MVGCRKQKRGVGWGLSVMPSDRRVAHSIIPSRPFLPHRASKRPYPQPSILSLSQPPCFATGVLIPPFALLPLLLRSAAQVVFVMWENGGRDTSGQYDRFDSFNAAAAGCVGKYVHEHVCSLARPSTPPHRIRSNAHTVSASSFVVQVRAVPPEAESGRPEHHLRRG